MLATLLGPGAGAGQAAGQALTPEADATVNANYVGRNYGTATKLEADASASPSKLPTEAYLRFTVPAIAGTISKVTLRVYATNGSVDGPAVYGAGNGWTESGITWDTRPARTTGALADVGAIGQNTWVGYDVTAHVTGAGTYTFVLASSSSDGTDVASREATNKPQLVVESVAPPPPAAATVGDATVNANSPATNYGGATTLEADAASAPNNLPTESYLKLPVPAGATTVRLRLSVTNGSVDGPAVYATGDFDEAAITWDTRPAKGALVADLGAVSAGAAVEVDVTKAIAGGMVIVALVSSSTDGTDFSSREGASPPQLVVPTASTDGQPWGPGGSWKLVFADDFDGTSLDTSKWRTDGNWGMGIACQDNKNNVKVFDGALHLYARSGQSSWCAESDYSSAVIQTAGYKDPRPFAFTYGFIEARVKIPAGRGLWPAVWTFNTGDDGAAEIDLAEWLAQETNKVYTSIHYHDSSSKTVSHTGIDWADGWHTIGVNWQPGLLVWYADGVELLRIVDSRVPSKAAYVILDITVGGWAGNPDASTPFPADFQVDYVRVWQAQ